MSISVTFDDYLYLLNETLHTNDTPYIVDPKTLSCEIQPMAPTVALTLCFLLIAIFLMAIPGNLLVGWVIASRRKPLTPSDVYLLHLTIADGVITLTVPFWAVAPVTGWIFGDFMCKFVNLIFDATFYTSILFLACISIDRYLVIVRASESLRSRQRMCSQLVCASVWALGGALALPALFNDVTRLSSNPQMMTCSEDFDIGRAWTWRLTTRLFLHVFGFFLPLCVMISCYGAAIIRLLRTRGFHKHRAMKVIIAVVAVFLLCWIPYHITRVVDTFLRADLILSPHCALRRSVNRALRITNSVALLHSCINPILYAFVGEKFRGNIAVIVQRRVRQERISGSKFSRSTSQTSENNGAVL